MLTLVPRFTLDQPTYLGGNFCALYTYAVALPSLAEMLKRHNKIMVKVVDGKQG
jgi:hypothetical protein